jgi:DNA-binding transcriptional LysR family regulator
MAKDPIGRLDLNLVFVFDALLRYQSVTRTATALNVTQGAVSHALRRLRTFFKDPLFTRTATGVVPTPRAVHLSSAVNEIASMVRRGLLNEAPFNPEQTGRTFSVCLSDLGELAILPTLLTALRKASPNSALRTVQTQPGESHAMLESGEVDIAIGAVPPGSGEIYRQLLYTEPAVVITHKSSSRRGEKMTLDAYCERPHVVVTPLLGRVSIFDAALARIGRQRHIVLTTQHHLIIPLLLERDPSLIGTVPEVLARSWQPRGTLKTFRLPFEFPLFEIAQYWHGRFHTDRQHIWFRNLVANCFQRPSLQQKPERYERR